MTVLLLSLMPAAQALNWEFEFREDTVEIELLNTASIGAGWRMEKQDKSLIGKASLPQNRNLCAPDDCIALTEDNTEPNERFLRAPGATASYADDGSINYKKGDLVAGTAKLSSRLHVFWRNYGLELSGLYFYDAVNTNFNETHTNRITEVGTQPGSFVRTKRSSKAEDQIGNAFELRNFNVFADFETPWGKDATIRVGRQLMNWGVSAFGVNGSLNFINPPDLNALVRPGFELYELYKPTGMIKFNTGLTDKLSLEAFYQYEWRSVGLPPKGAFFSFFDAGEKVVEDDHIPLPFSKTPEDPDQLQRGTGLISLISDTSFAAARAPNNEPKDGGQYGIALYYFAPDLGEGTEFGFYYSNYHARIPSASFFAADATCARAEGSATGRDATNAIELLVACEAGGGLSVDGLIGAVGALTGGSNQGGKLFGRDALPLDTAPYFLDYPEDIKVYGLTFNTSRWGAAIQGELAYRPDNPVQVDLEDVFFNALQPIFPRSRIDIPGVATLADVRTALPDRVGPFRGQTPGEVVPGSYVRGWEPLKTWFGNLGFLKIWGPDNIIPGADQFGFLLEFNSVYIQDMPDVEELALEAPGTFTHPSIGIRESGNALVLNPFQQPASNYVTDFSLGYRLGMLALYNNVFIPGLSLRPLVVLVHDVEGIAPGLAEIVLEGRKIILNNLEAKYENWSLNLQYGIFTGAGKQNTLRDRDVFALALSYDF